MKKSDNISTRIQMLRISLQTCTPEQTQLLLTNWSIRDLYDIVSVAEVADIVGMDENKFTPKELEIILLALNEKGNLHYGTICEMIDGLQKATDGEDIEWRVRLIYKMRKEYPQAALKEIDKQAPAWKKFFKEEWPALKKKFKLK